MKVLITGITGFMGAYLADYARSQTAEVHGLYRRESALENAGELRGSVARDHLHLADMRDWPSVLSVVQRVQPDWIFHLAAQTHVDTSRLAPQATLDTNIKATSNLLEAVRLLRSEYGSYDPRMLITSTAEVYGNLGAYAILDETMAFRPPNPYAVSKVTEEMLAVQHFLAHKTKTIRARLFTMTGPRRTQLFVEGSLASQIADAEVTEPTPRIVHGNVDTVRTWCDVRDGVRACWQLLENGEPGEAYNIAGDEVKSIREVLDMLLSMARQSLAAEVDPSRKRPTDIDRQRADTSKLRKAIDWQARIPLQESLRDLLDYYRKRVVDRRLSTHV